MNLRYAAVYVAGIDRSDYVSDRRQNPAFYKEKQYHKQSYGYYYEYYYL